MLSNNPAPSPERSLNTGWASLRQADPDASAPASSREEAGLAFLRRMHLLAGGLSGPFEVLFDDCAAESACAVLNLTPLAPNRYITGFDAAGTKYLVTAPEELVRDHKTLLEHAQACLGQSLNRIAAGMVRARPDGSIDVNGLSSITPVRDHEYAQERLTRLLEAADRARRP